MVIQEHAVASAEMSIEKPTTSDKKKYIIVKNHVRELPAGSENESTSNSVQSSSSDSIGKQKKTKKKKSESLFSFEKLSKIKHWLDSDSEPKKRLKPEECDKNDLEMLRSLYKDCRYIMNRIEDKYGHLLFENSDRKHKLDECTCSANKKIVFDEEGNQIVTEAVLEHHVCPKKLKTETKHIPLVTETFIPLKSNVQVEYDTATSLPDDIQSLSVLLQNPDMEKTDRNRAIDKVRMLRSEYTNDIRFNRPALLKEIKSDPGIIDFNGSNLATLPGYPDWKIVEEKS